MILKWCGLEKNNSSIIGEEEWSNNSEVLNAPLPWVLIPQSSCLELVPEGGGCTCALWEEGGKEVKRGREVVTFPCSLLQYYSRKRIEVLVKDDPYSHSAVRATDLLVPRKESVLLLIWLITFNLIQFVWVSRFDSNILGKHSYNERPMCHSVARSPDLLVVDSVVDSIHVV